MPIFEHDVDLYYTDAGNGEVILFCHGAGGNAASWYNQFGAFAGDYRCVAYDCRGFGRSTCTEEQFDGTRFGTDAIALLDHLGIESADFVCQSMGGWTGVQVALEHPDRVRRLVLSDTIGGIAVQSGIDSIRTLGERVSDTRLASAAIAADFPEKQPALAFLYAQISDFNRLPQGAVGGSLFDESVLVPLDRARTLSLPILIFAGPTTCCGRPMSCTNSPKSCRPRSASRSTPGTRRTSRTRRSSTGCSGRFSSARRMTERWKPPTQSCAAETWSR